ncbi:MAG TPA: ATP-binding cassette domain-containing protein [Candidatus Saccharimonadales bacterium]|nr:ATP-binding cassette domain-containing protein [Candidatus Saccharimonadales bacterium]
MGFVDVQGLRHVLPDGSVLFDDVSFRVGEGSKTALLGANGAGKTTVLRMIAGDLKPQVGTISSAGGLGVMRQFMGSADGVRTVRDLLISVSPASLRRAARALDATEARLDEEGGESAGAAYAQAVADYADAGGYDEESVWTLCTNAALGEDYTIAAARSVDELSGGEQKRLMLDALLRGTSTVLLLDEPDNYLDVPSKEWLEAALVASTKTVLFITHDRELLSRTAQRIVTLEGHGAWIHGGGYGTYVEARRGRTERLEELHRRWTEEHERIIEYVRTLQQQAARSPAMAARYKAAQTRLRHFEEKDRPAERPSEQQVRMRLRGGRTGVQAIICKKLELTGLLQPFDLDVVFGERVAIVGPNGSGKSHFLSLLAGEAVAHTGDFRLGARVVPGVFSQLHRRPDLAGRTPVEVLANAQLERGKAIGMLRRYGLDRSADQVFETLSGGQQARLQILLLEVDGATLLLLDEPTDNLDVDSAQALEDGLQAYEGTVLVVTHDRWFARSFDRFLVFGEDARVWESADPVWTQPLSRAASSRRDPASATRV